MPSLGPLAAYHPQVVHFAIALLVVGVLLRWLALSGRVAFAGPAALLLLLLGTGASFLAVVSGDQAHGPVERMPGARAVVHEHEEWGERTRNLFIGVAALELAALALVRRGKAKPLWLASGVLGLVGMLCVYETGEHGGAIVYGHAGGVGLRSGDPADVGRLLLAGLYQQSQIDRKAGRFEQAAELVDFAARRFPNDLEVQLLRAESMLLDRKDAPAALALLAQLQVPPDQRPLRLRHGFLTADALLAQGQKDAARATLQGLRSDFPGNRGLEKRLSELGR